MTTAVKEQTLLLFAILILSTTDIGLAELRAA
jgi:hypothetical protein